MFIEVITSYDFRVLLDITKVKTIEETDGGLSVLIDNVYYKTPYDSIQKQIMKLQQPRFVIGGVCDDED